MAADAADAEPSRPGKHLSQVSSYLRKVFDRIMEAGSVFSPRENKMGLCVKRNWVIQGLGVRVKVDETKYFFFF